MIRVAFALGSWQIVALAAALREASARDSRGAADGQNEDGQREEVEHEDVLVLYETVGASDALKTAMHEIARAVWPWRRIVWAFQLFASVQRRIGQAEFTALRTRLRLHLRLDHADELWLCWLTRPAEKLIMDTYPAARVVLYEDGLFSYLPVPLTPPEPKAGSLRLRWRERLDRWRPVRRFRRYKNWLDPRHAARIDAAWMMLPEIAPPPPAFAHVPRHAIGMPAVRATLAACASLPSVADYRLQGDASARRPSLDQAALDSIPDHYRPDRHFPDRARPRVLLLGQTLARWDVMSRAEELALYERVVGRIVSRGYDVWWKEHPRVQEPFFAELEQKTPRGRIHLVDLPFALPVELVAERMNLAACAAGISSALFYLPRIFAIPAYTFADQMIPFMTGRWAEQNDLVRSAVPSLDALPMAAGRGAT